MLVTVAVATYNSSKYVLETLDSVYSQTYPEIELIVSDDASSDNTVSIVEKWVNTHKERFVNVQIITVKNNTGTSANSNRIIEAANGVWIKDLAGDDILLPDAIDKYCEYVYNNPSVKWVYSLALCYKNNFNESCIVNRYPNHSSFCKRLNTWNANEQLRELRVVNCFKYPTHFLLKKLLEEVGGYDEEFGILEDYPMWLKLLSLGEKCFFLDDYTLGYRISNQGVSKNQHVIVNYKLEKLMYLAKKKYLFERCSKCVKFSSVLRYWNAKLFSIKILNKRSCWRLFLYNFLNKISFLPIYIYDRL